MSRVARALVSRTDGSCSFCGKSRRETKAFVGSTLMDVIICEACLGLCCSILAEAAGASESSPECSADEFPPDVLAKLNATLRTKPPRVTLPPSPEFRCSFCDASRPDDVPVLVSGPRVFICNECVVEGVDVVQSGT